jgi:hypothetical protein
MHATMKSLKLMKCVGDRILLELTSTALRSVYRPGKVPTPT